MLGVYSRGRLGEGRQFIQVVLRCASPRWNFYFGSPSIPQDWSLAREDTCVIFSRTCTTIGRNKERADYFIGSTSKVQNACISRLHARVVRQGTTHKLYDDSLNGIFVNNIKIGDATVLVEGDTVTFGHRNGKNIAPGTRQRQPDSEYQFLFERCDCPVPTTQANRPHPAPQGQTSAPHPTLRITRTSAQRTVHVNAAVCRSVAEVDRTHHSQSVHTQDNQEEVYRTFPSSFSDGQEVVFSAQPPSSYSGDQQDIEDGRTLQQANTPSENQEVGMGDRVLLPLNRSSTDQEVEFDKTSQPLSRCSEDLQVPVVENDRALQSKNRTSRNQQSVNKDTAPPQQRIDSEDVKLEEDGIPQSAGRNSSEHQVIEEERSMQDPSRHSGAEQIADPPDISQLPSVHTVKENTQSPPNRYAHDPQIAEYDGQTLQSSDSHTEALNTCTADQLVDEDQTLQQPCRHPEEQQVDNTTPLHHSSHSEDQQLDSHISHQPPSAPLERQEDLEVDTTLQVPSMLSEGPVAGAEQTTPQTEHREDQQVNNTENENNTDKLISKHSEDPQIEENQTLQSSSKYSGDQEDNDYKRSLEVAGDKTSPACTEQSEDQQNIEEGTSLQPTNTPYVHQQLEEGGTAQPSSERFDNRPEEGDQHSASQLKMEKEASGHKQTDDQQVEEPKSLQDIDGDVSLSQQCGDQERVKEEITVHSEHRHSKIQQGKESRTSQPQSVPCNDQQVERDTTCQCEDAEEGSQHTTPRDSIKTPAGTDQQAVTQRVHSNHQVVELEDKTPQVPSHGQQMIEDKQHMSDTTRDTEEIVTVVESEREICDGNSKEDSIPIDEKAADLEEGTQICSEEDGDKENILYKEHDGMLPTSDLDEEVQQVKVSNEACDTENEIAFPTNDCISSKQNEEILMTESDNDQNVEVQVDNKVCKHMLSVSLCDDQEVGSISEVHGTPELEEVPVVSHIQCVTVVEEVFGSTDYCANLEKVPVGEVHVAMDNKEVPAHMEHSINEELTANEIHGAKDVTTVAVSEIHATAEPTASEENGGPGMEEVPISVECVTTDPNEILASKLHCATTIKEAPVSTEGSTSGEEIPVNEVPVSIEESITESTGEVCYPAGCEEVPANEDYGAAEDVSTHEILVHTATEPEEVIDLNELIASGVHDLEHVTTPVNEASATDTTEDVSANQVHGATDPKESLASELHDTTELGNVHVVDKHADAGHEEVPASEVCGATDPEVPIIEKHDDIDLEDNTVSEVHSVADPGQFPDSEDVGATDLEEVPVIEIHDATKPEVSSEMLDTIHPKEVAPRVDVSVSDHEEVPGSEVSSANGIDVVPASEILHATDLDKVTASEVHGTTDLEEVIEKHSVTEPEEVPVSVQHDTTDFEVVTVCEIHNTTDLEEVPACDSDSDAVPSSEFQGEVEEGHVLEKHEATELEVVPAREVLDGLEITDLEDVTKSEEQDPTDPHVDSVNVIRDESNIEDLPASEDCATNIEKVTSNELHGATDPAEVTCNEKHGATDTVEVTSSEIHCVIDPVEVHTSEMHDTGPQKVNAIENVDITDSEEVPTSEEVGGADLEEVHVMENHSATEPAGVPASEDIDGTALDMVPESKVWTDHDLEVVPVPVDEASELCGAAKLPEVHANEEHSAMDLEEVSSCKVHGATELEGALISKLHSATDPEEVPVGLEYSKPITDLDEVPVTEKHGATVLEVVNTRESCATTFEEGPDFELHDATNVQVHTCVSQSTTDPVEVPASKVHSATDLEVPDSGEDCPIDASELHATTTSEKVHPSEIQHVVDPQEVTDVMKVTPSEEHSATDPGDSTSSESHGTNGIDHEEQLPSEGSDNDVKEDQTLMLPYDPESHTPTEVYYPNQREISIINNGDSIEDCTDDLQLEIPIQDRDHYSDEDVIVVHGINREYQTAEVLKMDSDHVVEFHTDKQEEETIIKDYHEEERDTMTAEESNDVVAHHVGLPLPTRDAKEEEVTSPDLTSAEQDTEFLNKDYDHDKEGLLRKEQESDDEEQKSFDLGGGECLPSKDHTCTAMEDKKPIQGKDMESIHAADIVQSGPTKDCDTKEVTGDLPGGDDVEDVSGIEGQNVAISNQICDFDEKKDGMHNFIHNGQQTQIQTNEGDHSEAKRESHDGDEKAEMPVHCNDDEHEVPLHKEHGITEHDMGSPNKEDVDDLHQYQDHQDTLNEDSNVKDNGRKILNHGEYDGKTEKASQQDGYEMDDKKVANEECNNIGFEAELLVRDKTCNEPIMDQGSNAEQLPGMPPSSPKVQIDIEDNTAVHQEIASPERENTVHPETENPYPIIHDIQDDALKGRNSVDAHDQKGHCSEQDLEISPIVNVAHSENMEIAVLKSDVDSPQVGISNEDKHMEDKKLTILTDNLVHLADTILKANSERVNNPCDEGNQRFDSTTEDHGMDILSDVHKDDQEHDTSEQSGQTEKDHGTESCEITTILHKHIEHDPAKVETMLKPEVELDLSNLTNGTAPKLPEPDENECEISSANNMEQLPSESPLNDKPSIMVEQHSSNLHSSTGGIPVHTMQAGKDNQVISPEVSESKSQVQTNMTNEEQDDDLQAEETKLSIASLADEEASYKSDSDSVATEAFSICEMDDQEGEALNETKVVYEGLELSSDDVLDDKGSQDTETDLVNEQLGLSLCTDDGEYTVSTADEGSVSGRVTSLHGDDSTDASDDGEVNPADTYPLIKSRNISAMSQEDSLSESSDNGDYSCSSSVEYPLQEGDESDLDSESECKTKPSADCESEPLSSTVASPVKKAESMVGGADVHSLVDVQDNVEHRGCEELHDNSEETFHELSVKGPVESLECVSDEQSSTLAGPIQQSPSFLHSEHIVKPSEDVKELTPDTGVHISATLIDETDNDTTVDHDYSQSEGKEVDLRQPACIEHEMKGTDEEIYTDVTCVSELGAVDETNLASQILKLEDTDAAPTSLEKPTAEDTDSHLTSPQISTVEDVGVRTSGDVLTPEMAKFENTGAEIISQVATTGDIDNVPMPQIPTTEDTDVQTPQMSTTDLASQVATTEDIDISMPQVATIVDTDADLISQVVTIEEIEIDSNSMPPVATTEDTNVVLTPQMVATTEDTNANLASQVATTADIDNASMPQVATTEVTDVVPTPQMTTTGDIDNVPMSQIGTIEVTDVVLTPQMATAADIDNVPMPQIATTEDTDVVLTPQMAATTEDTDADLTSQVVTIEEMDSILMPPVATTEVTDVLTPQVTTTGHIDNVPMAQIGTIEVTDVVLTPQMATTADIDNVPMPQIVTTEDTDVVLTPQMAATTEDTDADLTSQVVTIEEMDSILMPPVATTEVTDVLTPQVTTTGHIDNVPMAQIGTIEVTDVVLTPQMATTADIDNVPMPQIVTTEDTDVVLTPQMAATTEDTDADLASQVVTIEEIASIPMPPVATEDTDAVLTPQMVAPTEDTDADLASQVVTTAENGSIPMPLIATTEDTDVVLTPQIVTTADNDNVPMPQIATTEDTDVVLTPQMAATTEDTDADLASQVVTIEEIASIPMPPVATEDTDAVLTPQMVAPTEDTDADLASRVVTTAENGSIPMPLIATTEDTDVVLTPQIVTTADNDNVPMPQIATIEDTNVVLTPQMAATTEDTDADLASQVVTIEEIDSISMPPVATEDTDADLASQVVTIEEIDSISMPPVATEDTDAVLTPQMAATTENTDADLTSQVVTTVDIDDASIPQVATTELTDVVLTPQMATTVDTGAVLTSNVVTAEDTDVVLTALEDTTEDTDPVLTSQIAATEDIDAVLTLPHVTATEKTGAVPTALQVTTAKSTDAVQTSEMTASENTHVPKSTEEAMKDGSLTALPEIEVLDGNLAITESFEAVVVPPQITSAEDTNTVSTLTEDTEAVITLPLLTTTEDTITVPTSPQTTATEDVDTVLKSPKTTSSGPLEALSERGTVDGKLTQPGESSAIQLTMAKDTDTGLTTSQMTTNEDTDGIQMSTEETMKPQGGMGAMLNGDTFENFTSESQVIDSDKSAEQYTDESDDKLPVEASSEKAVADEAVTENCEARESNGLEGEAPDDVTAEPSDTVTPVDNIHIVVSDSHSSTPAGEEEEDIPLSEERAETGTQSVKAKDEQYIEISAGDIDVGISVKNVLDVQEEESVDLVASESEATKDADLIYGTDTQSITEECEKQTLIGDQRKATFIDSTAPDDSKEIGAQVVPDEAVVLAAKAGVNENLQSGIPQNEDNVEKAVLEPEVKNDEAPSTECLSDQKSVSEVEQLRSEPREEAASDKPLDKAVEETQSRVGLTLQEQQGPPPVLVNDHSRFSATSGNQSPYSPAVLRNEYGLSTPSFSCVRKNIQDHYTPLSSPSKRPRLDSVLSTSINTEGECDHPSGSQDSVEDGQFSDVDSDEEADLLNPGLFTTSLQKFSSQNLRKPNTGLLHGEDYREQVNTEKTPCSNAIAVGSIDVSEFNTENVEVLKPQEQTVTMEECIDDSVKTMMVIRDVEIPDSHGHMFNADATVTMKPDGNIPETFAESGDMQESCKQLIGGECETVCVSTSMEDLAASCLQASQEDMEVQERILREECNKSQHVNINQDGDFVHPCQDDSEKQITNEGIKRDVATTSITNSNLEQPCQEVKDSQEQSAAEEDKEDVVNSVKAAIEPCQENLVSHEKIHEQESIEEINSTAIVNPIGNVPQKCKENVEMQMSHKQFLGQQNNEKDVCNEAILNAASDSPQPSKETIQESYLQIEGEGCTEEDVPANGVRNPDSLQPRPEVVEIQELHEQVINGEGNEAVVSTDVSLNPAEAQEHMEIQESPEEVLREESHQEDICGVNSAGDMMGACQEKTVSCEQIQEQECIEEIINNTRILNPLGNIPLGCQENPKLLQSHPEVAEVDESHDQVLEEECTEEAVRNDVVVNPPKAQEGIEVQQSHEEVLRTEENVFMVNAATELLQSHPKIVEVQVPHDHVLEDIHDQVVGAKKIVIPGDELQDPLEVLEMQQSADQVLESECTKEVSCNEVIVGPVEGQDVKLRKSPEVPREECDQGDIGGGNTATEKIGVCQEKEDSHEQIQEETCIEEINNTRILNAAGNVPQECQENQLLHSLSEVHDQDLAEKSTEEVICTDVSINPPEAQEDLEVQDTHEGVQTEECDKADVCTSDIVNPASELLEPSPDVVEESEEQNQGEEFNGNANEITIPGGDILQPRPDVIVVQGSHDRVLGEECTEEVISIDGVNVAEMQEQVQKSHKEVPREECREVICPSDIVHPARQLLEPQTEVVEVEESHDQVSKEECAAEIISTNEIVPPPGDVLQPRPEVVEVHKQLCSQEYSEDIFSNANVNEDEALQTSCPEIMVLQQSQMQAPGEECSEEDAATNIIVRPTEVLPSPHLDICQAHSDKQDVVEVCKEQDEDSRTDSQWQNVECQNAGLPCTSTTYRDIVPINATTKDSAASHSNKITHVVEISPMTASQLDTATRTLSLPGINTAADLSLEIPPSDGEVVPDSQHDDSQISPVIPITYASSVPGQESAINQPEFPTTTTTAEAMFDDDEGDQSQPLAINMHALDSDDGNEAFPSSQRAFSERTAKRPLQTESDSEEDFAPSQMSFRSPLKKHKLKRLSQKRPRRNKRSHQDDDDDDTVNTTSSPKPSRIDSLLNRVRAKRQCRRTTTDSESDISVSREEPVAAMPDTISPRLQHRRSKIDSAEEHVSRAAAIINEAQGILESNNKLSSYQRVNAWQDELRKLKSTAHLPETVIAVVGDTGSGKSSVMNALIGHASVLPTSGMRACTAVVVEVKDNADSNYYEGEIQFLEKEEWYRELETLLKELQGADGRVRACQPDPNSDLIVAWTKVRAVYGSFQDGVTLQTLPKMKHVTSYLGRTKTVKERNPAVFRRKVDNYIESTNGRDGGQLWPIVKKVSLRIPNCSVCSSGATLVDLPGIRDSNAARDKIAKEYLQRCTAVWVVASIHRAVDDKTAKELLGEHFRRQLLMDGQYGSVSFVCTKTDIHSQSELIGGLNLHDQIAPHEEAIEDLKREDEAVRENMKWLQETVMQLKNQISALRNERKEYQSILVELQTALEDDEEDKTDELLTEKKNLECLLPQKENEMKALKEKMRKHIQEIETSKNKIHEQEKLIASRRKSISSICVLARNEFAKYEIRRDFKAGLREMKRRAGMTDDMQDDEDEFESEGEEDEDILRTTNNLKVFCVSSTEYLKLNRLLPSNDGPPQVFQTVEETGVPALEQHVHVMTGVRRQQGTEQLICSVHQCVQNVESYLMDEGTKTARTRGHAKGVIVDQIRRFEETGLAVVHAETTGHIQRLFESCLKEKIDEGKQTAIERAELIVAKWGSKQSKENKGEGGLHFSTYKAACRRFGVFKSPTAGNIDFNEDLTNPVYTSISIVWDRVFNMSLSVQLENFKKHIIEEINLFVQELQGTLQSIGVAVDRLQRTEQHLKQRVEHTVSVALTETKAYIADRQREISRVVTPKVQESMKPAYERCNAETGKGTHNRMKQHMQHHVETEKYTFFNESSRWLYSLLCELQDQIREMLAEIIRRVVGDCEQVLEPYWQEPCNTKAFRQAFLQGIKKCLNKISELSLDAGVALPAIPQPRSPTPSPPVTSALASSAMASSSGEPLPNSSGSLPCGCYSVVSYGARQQFVNMSGECQIHCPTSHSEQEESDEVASNPFKVKQEKQKVYGDQKPTGGADIRPAMGSMKQSKENIPRTDGGDTKQKALPTPTTQSGQKRPLVHASQPQHTNVQSSKRLSLPKTPSKELTPVRVKQEPGVPVPKKQRPIDHSVIDLTISSDEDSNDDLPPMASIFFGSSQNR